MVGLHQDGISNIFSKWKHETMKYKIAWSLLAVAVAGCGEVTPKDGSPDAGADGPPAEQPVKVHVLGMDAEGQGTGISDPNAVAIFVGADNTVLKHGTVGPQGEAQSLMPAGGMVQTIQVLETSTTARRVFIMSFHDVKPGDVVNAGVPLVLPDKHGVVSSMTGTFTATTGYDHRFETDCGDVTSAGPTVALSLYPNCRGTTIDLLATQTPTIQPSRLPPRFLSMSFPFVAGGPFTIPGNWVAMDLFTVALTNTPEDITSVRFDRWTQLKSGASARVYNQNFTTVDDPPAGTVSATLRYPQGAGKRAVVSAQLNKAVGGFASQRLDVQTADVTNAQGIDATELALPWISAVRFAGAERKLTWTETGAGAADLRVAISSYKYIRNGITYNIVAYDFAAPTAAPSLVFPALPADYAELDPAQQSVDVIPGIGAVGYVDQSNLNGYDQARTQGISLVSAPGITEAFSDQAYRRRTTLASMQQGVAGLAAPEQLSSLIPGL
jgi:hypothetical protein